MIYHIIRFLVPGFSKSVVGVVCDIPHYKVLMVLGFCKSVVGVVCDIPHYKVPGSWFQ